MMSLLQENQNNPETPHEKREATFLTHLPKITKTSQPMILQS